jgi:two-component system LytT family response regulator
MREMNVLIIEDEPLAAKQLKDMIADCCAEATFCPMVDSVEDAVTFLQSHSEVDIIFMDIHLSDGDAFEIFDAVETELPIIFTTAYDQYAIKAFEVNSIDYLLKPISREKVQKAIAKFEKRSEHNDRNLKHADIKQLRRLLTETSIYRENFLISFKDKLLPIPVKDFAWFEIKNGVVIGSRFDKTTVVLEERSLDELAAVIDPKQFYRANRQYLINKSAVKEIAHYFNGKLMAVMLPPPSQPVVISREKTAAFKSWISG